MLLSIVQNVYNSSSNIHSVVIYQYRNNMLYSCTDTQLSSYTEFVHQTTAGKTTISAPHDAQLLLNRQQHICGGVYIH